MLTQRPGFSLIELMVVTGLIAILVAVAIPQYQGFQSRARQLEAKIALSAIYQGQKVTFAEHGHYTSCLSSFYSPELAAPGVARGYYARGIANITFEPPGIDCTGGLNAWSASLSVSAPSAARLGALEVPDGWTGCCGNQGESFVAGAAGNVSATSPNFDYWTMDQNQALANPRPVP